MPRPHDTLTWGFSLLWCGLAGAQTARSFVACDAAGTWVAFYWGLHVVALAAPLFVLRRLLVAAPGGRRVDVPLTLVLLTYVPLTAAMRLVESCSATP